MILIPNILKSIMSNQIMRELVLIISFLSISFNCFPSHLLGAEMFAERNPGSLLNFNITLHLFTHSPEWGSEGNTIINFGDSRGDFTLDNVFTTVSAERMPRISSM